MENKILAKIDDKNITMEDFSFFMDSLNPQVRAYFSNQGKQDEILKELINQEMFYIEALENGFDKDEEFVKVLEQTKSSLLKTYALSKLLKDVKPTEKEIEDFYKLHEEKYNSPKTVVASHILVESEEKANELFEKVSAGENFVSLAKENSICPSKENGGSLGAFGEGQMVPEFNDVVFTMIEGEISKPVKTQFGYHIIKLDKVNPAKKSDLEEVKDQVREEARKLKEQEVYTKKIKELSKKHKIEIIKEESEK